MADTKIEKKIIKNPRVTEKVATLADKNIYTFDVSSTVTKNEIKKDFEKKYKVKPVKVNITKIQEKIVMRRGRKGIKSGGKKAVVYLKKGDKIEFV
ncbi:MAG: 50S ribosomal protein L23 [Candidatus Nomurabacteria bacterium]|nr:50S ribosomal protein L23 [Candidatus Nomurabacteria bacterium]